MWGYEPPVSVLLTLGEPIRGHTCTYAKFGIGQQHIEELIRLMMDPTPVDSGDVPDVYGQVHAWRALGQLRAEEAILPMLDLIAENADAELDIDAWDDWTADELPRMIGQIGPAAIPVIVQRLNERSPREEATSHYANALTEIAKQHPQSRSEVVTHLSRILESAERELPHVNGFVIAHLLDLNAVESMPAIEAAFATGSVDSMIAGDLARVKFSLGLGPAPVRRDPWEIFRRAGATLPTAVPTAKERADARAKQRKAEKRQQKKLRKAK